MPVEGTLRGFLAVILRVAAASDPEDSLRAIVRALVEEMGFKAAILRLADPEREDRECLLVLGAAHGLSAEYLAKGEVSVAAGSLDATVLAGQAVELLDVTRDAAFQYGERARLEGIRSVLAVPVRVHGVPRGVLRAYTAEERHFTAEERELMSALAQLSGELLERSRREQAIQAIMRDLSSTLDAEEVADRLLRHTVEGLHFSGAVLRLLDDDSEGLLVVGARGLSDEYLRAGERRADDPAFERVLDGETVIIHDLAAEGGLPFTRAALDEGIRSVLSVPLVSRGQARGVLRVYSKRVRRFDAHEVRFVRLVAELGALALENAHLHGLLADRVEALGAEASGWYQFLALS